MTEMDKKDLEARKIIEVLRQAGDNKAELAVLCFGLGLEAAMCTEQQPPKTA